jgi:hypothetical protein
MTNPLLLPRVSSHVPTFFWLGLNSYRHSSPNNTCFMTSPASNHSIISHSEGTNVCGLQEGGIYTVSTRRRMNGVVSSLPTLVFREDRVVQLVKRSEFFLVHKTELSEIGQLKSLNRCFPQQTSCTNRKKCR